MKIDSTDYMLLSKSDQKSIFARKFEKKAMTSLADEQEANFLLRLSPLKEFRVIPHSINR